MGRTRAVAEDHDDDAKMDAGGGGNATMSRQHPSVDIDAAIAPTRRGRRRCLMMFFYFYENTKKEKIKEGDGRTFRLSSPFSIGAGVVAVVR